MAQRLQFDVQDQAALRALDDTFTLDAAGEVATVTGEMEVEVIRLADDDGARFKLTIRFPNGEELEVRIARQQLLQELEIAADEG